MQRSVRLKPNQANSKQSQSHSATKHKSKSKRRKSKQQTTIQTSKRSFQLFNVGGPSVSFKNTSTNDALKQRNPLMKHSNRTPDLPLSQLPEDEQTHSYRKLIRDCTDRVITVRRNNAEPYSYTHQIYAMHSIDPENFGDAASQLVNPSRLVLDGPGGLEALAYYDHSVSLPRAVDADVAEMKAYARTLLLDFQKPNSDLLPRQDWFSPDEGLRNMQRSKIPTTFHSNFFLTNTHHGYKHDLEQANVVYSGHLAYAETSTALKNIGFWDVSSGSADQVVGQHYALPGMLVATTSPKSLGYVAAMGGISHRVSPVEAAAIIAGQPVQTFQPANPVQVNLQSALAQWVGPHDIATMIIQYLGETAFHSSPLGTQQPISVELTDKGNQFSIDELASICSIIGSLPNVASITVPPNATQRKYLRDTNRGAYSQLLHEYGPQLLEPDHKYIATDTVHIDLSQIIPQVSVHAASIHNLTTPSPSNLTLAPPPPPNNTSTQSQALNTVSCPMDYLDAITGTNPSKRLNLAKLTHIDNIAHHPALRSEMFHTGTTLQKVFIQHPNSKKDQQVLPNRYKYLDSNSDHESKLQKAFDRTIKGTPLEKVFNPSDDTTTKKIEPRPTADDNGNTKKHVSLFASRANAQNQSPVVNDPNVVSIDDGSGQKDFFGEEMARLPTPTHQRQVDNTLTPPSSTVGLVPKPNHALNTPTSQQKTVGLHPQQLKNQQALQQRPQQQQSHANNFWPQSPNIIMIRGGYTEMLKAVRIMIQCMSEGMKPKVDMTCLQFDSKQSFELIKNDHSLIDSSGTHFLDRCDDFGITILAPGAGNIDAIVSKVVLTEAANIQAQYDKDFTQQQEQSNNSNLPQFKRPRHVVDPKDLHPTILTTDIGLTIQDGGLGHYTTNLFTSSHEHTALTAFTGQLGYDPINSTLSPQTGTHNPGDQNSFFVLPSNGVEPAIDSETNKLVRRVPSGKSFQESSVISPSHSIPSSVLSTEYNIALRIDLPDQTSNSRYTESRPVKRLPPFSELETTLSTSPYHRTIVKSARFIDENDVVWGEGEGDRVDEGITSLHDSINLHLTSPTKLGYKRRVKVVDPLGPTVPDMTKRFVQLVNETNHQQTIYPSQWWNNQDLMNLPILCNANLPTSAADIAGTNSALRLTPVQQYVMKGGLNEWVNDNLLFPTDDISTSTESNNNATVSDPDSSTHSITTQSNKNTKTKSKTNQPQTEIVDPHQDDERITTAAIFTDLIERRLQTTPRHLKTLFPYHQPHLQLRYGLSGLRSTHTGAVPQYGKPEFVAAAQPQTTLPAAGQHDVSTPTATAPPHSNQGANTSQIGVALGIRLAHLKEVLRAAQWGSFLLPLVPRDTVGMGVAPSTAEDDTYFHNIAQNIGIDSDPTTTATPTTITPPGQKPTTPSTNSGIKSVLRNHFAEETNLLWTTTPNHVAQSFGDYKPIPSPNPKSGENNEFISNLMPAVRTFLKLPSNSAPVTANVNTAASYTQELVNSRSNNTSTQSIQSIAWNYFASGQKWVLVGDGGLPMKISADKNFRENDRDDQQRWDQRGFGFGTIDECDDAAKTLRLLGCQAVVASKLNATMMRALRSHGILTAQLDHPYDYMKFSINDTISIMTHHQPEPEDVKTDDAVAGGAAEDKSKVAQKGPKPPRTELFTPHHSPMLILHNNANSTNMGQHRGTTQHNSVIKSVEIPVSIDYDPHSLVWFRSGSAANAGVEYQMRRALVDKAEQITGYEAEVRYS